MIPVLLVAVAAAVAAAAAFVVLHHRNRPLSSQSAQVEVDRRGIIRRASVPFTELVGTDPVVSTRLSDLVHPDDLGVFAATVLGDLKAGHPVRGSFRLVRPDTEVRHVELADAGGSSRSRRLVVVDTAPPTPTESEDRRVDPLTGLANRAALIDHLTTALREARNGTRPVVLLVGLEGLDGLDQRAREIVILEASHRLLTIARGVDRVMRLHEFEFAVVAEGVTDNDAALAAARRIGRALEGPVLLANGEGLALRASIGVAHALADESAATVLHRAVEALARVRGI